MASIRKLSPEDAAKKAELEEIISAAKAAIAELERAHIRACTDEIKAEMVRKMRENLTATYTNFEPFLERCLAKITWGPIETHPRFMNKYGTATDVHSIMYHWGSIPVMFYRVDHSSDGYYDGLKCLEGFKLPEWYDGIEFPDLWESSYPLRPLIKGGIADKVSDFLRCSKEKSQAGMPDLEAELASIPEPYQLAVVYSDPVMGLYHECVVPENHDL